ncbi:MAG: hypothetical protein NVSMB38_01540 [Ktedonobacteraceae bacterium]
MSFLLQVAQANDVCGFHIGPVPVIMFNKAEHVQSILVEHTYDFSKGRILHKAAKVQQEVDMVLQGRTPTYDDLAHLPYCLQVFKETMRLYPPAAAILREALHDIEIDGYLVPKGYNVFLSPYTIQHNPTYFPNPEVFDPEHFTLEHEKQLPRHSYIPFGAGPRICIGNYFALMEGQLLIATLAQHTTFTLIPEQVIEADPVHNLALRPGGKVEAVVRKR